MRGAAEILRLAVAGALPVVAYLAVGLVAVRSLRPGARGAERLALAWVLGTGAASLAILGLRLVDIPVPGWALAIVAVVAAALARPARTDREPSPDAAWVRAVDATTVAVAALTLVAALGPETFWDGFEYHLPMIRAWTEGPIRALPGVLDAEFRAGVDLLYVPALTMGQPDAAAVVSAGFAAALAALIRAEARRRASAGAAAIAGFFSLVVAFTADNAVSSYVDLGVGAYGFVALLSADRWNRGGSERDLLVSAACLAFACNAKLHAAAIAPALAAIVLLGGRPAPVAALARAAAVAAALTLPWLAKSALTSGNPFFPFFGDAFGTGAATPTHLALRRFRLSTDFPVERNPWGFARYLASLALGRNPHLSGLLGPLPFALLPAAVHRLSRATLVLTLSLAALFVLQFCFMPALRFGAPILPFVAVGCAVGGARIAGASPASGRVLAAILAVLALHHGTATAARYLPRIRAIADPGAYERATFPDQVSLRDVVARGSGVVAIPMGAVLWMPRPVYVLNWERNGEIFFERTAGHLTPPDALLARLRERGVGSLVLDVPPSRRASGRVGNAAVDVWLADGRAVLRRDIAPAPARGGRVWVLVDLR